MSQLAPFQTDLRTWLCRHPVAQLRGGETQPGHEGKAFQCFSTPHISNSRKLDIFDKFLAIFWIFLESSMSISILLDIQS